MTDYEGGCHCGAVGFRYTTDREPHAWSVRACQCSFCRKHDALSTSDAAGHLRFRSDDPETLQRYRFALRTADFLLCRRCGVYVGAVIDVAGKQYGNNNIHALVDPPRDMASVEPVSYDAEETDDRIGRRAERWTPVG